jgi:hypothetical protein
MSLIHIDNFGIRRRRSAEMPRPGWPLRSDGAGARVRCTSMPSLGLSLTSAICTNSRVMR